MSIEIEDRNLQLALSDDKRTLRAIVRVPERKWASDPVTTVSRREVLAIVTREYPEFEIVSGPRKITNLDSDTHVGTWVFEIKLPPKIESTPQQKPKTANTAPAPKTANTAPAPKTKRAPRRKKS